MMDDTPSREEHSRDAGLESGAGQANAARRSLPVPERPSLPRPERLNRNILTVAAVILGLLVIAAVVFMPTERAPSDRAAAVSQATPTPTPSFLDQPMPFVPGPDSVPAAQDSVARLGDGRVTPTHDLSWRGTADSPATVALSSTNRPAVDPAREARAAAYRAALEAPLVARAAAANTNDTGVAPAAGPSASAVWGRHQAFMAEVASRTSTAIRTSVQRAPGPYALQAGTLIPAVLVTEINSDLPGGVLAQVARNVYDSRTQRTLLVPKGSRLLGTYENELAAGQDRLFVAWTRVIFPDGRSVSLPGLETKDRAGAGGVADRVDRHTRRVFGTAALLSLVGAAAQLSQPNGGYGPLGAFPSPGQVAAGAVGQQLAQVATQMLQRDLAVQPTIRIRQGTPFNVFVATDLTFEAPYDEEREEPRP